MSAPDSLVASMMAGNGTNDLLSSPSERMTMAVRSPRKGFSVSLKI